MKKNKTHGFLPVMAALSGNIFITAIKWLGFFMSGSGAMFSEAVHSIADVINQIFLMIGIQRSQKPSNVDYPYGFGGERFFWAIISACSIFFVGAGITIYRGIDSLLRPEEVHLEPIVFFILAISFFIEFGTFIIALKELKGRNKEKDLKEMLAQGDPTTIAVLYEDGIAVFGIIIALGSILLTYLTGKAYWDAIGSIAIGILLATMALVLINKNRAFLMRKSIPEEIEEKVIKILESDPAIEKVLNFKSGVLDIGKWHIKCEVEFNGSALMRTMYRDGLKHEYKEVKEDYNDFLRFCVDYADRVPRMIGTRIDEIESLIVKKIPEIQYIDIEVN